MRKIEYSLIVIVLVFVSVVLPIFNKENVMDFGNSSDIASALCNVAMASAAVYAAIRAREWFQDKSSLNHLDTSHQFALQYEALLWKTNEKVFNDVIVRQELISQIKRLSTDLPLLNDYLKKTVLNYVRLEVEYYGSLKNHQMMLGRYNITMSERLLNLTDKILDARNLYFIEHSNVMYEILGKITLGDRMIETIDMSKVEIKMKNVSRLFEKELVKVKIESDYNFH